MKKYEQILNDLNKFFRDCFYEEWDGKIFKTCKCCGEIFPQHKLFFKTHNNGRYFDGKCKECNGIDFISKNLTIMFKNYIPDGYKYCIGCDSMFPMNEKYFTINNSSTTGFHSICKKCRGF